MKKLLGSFVILSFFMVSFVLLSPANASVEKPETIKGKIISINEYLMMNNQSSKSEGDYEHNHDAETGHSHVYKINLRSDVYKPRLALETPAGNIWYFVENDRSKHLIYNSDYIGKEVEILGYKLKLHKLTMSSYVDVVSYKIDGKKMVWCEGCNAMGPKHSH